MKLILSEKKEEVLGVTSFILTPTEPLEWKAGQYIHYVLHHKPTDDRGSDRWFTVSAAPFEKHIMITTRFTPDKGSSFKNKLFSLEVGKKVEMSVVEGDFTVEDADQQYVFIAGGIGITPFRSIIKQLEFEKKPINVTLLYANRDQDVVFKDELEAIATVNQNFKIHYIFSPQHIDENTVKQFVPDLQTPIFYVSGPEPMVDSLSDMLKNMGIPEEHIKGDWFPGYPADL